MESFDNKILHYKKVNIFGSRGVGKKSLTKALENYHDKTYKLEDDEKNNNINNNNKVNTVDDYSLENLKFISEVKKVKVLDQNNNKMYFNFYITDILNINFIKMNFDTLFFQSEGIILMIDITNSTSFNSVKTMVEFIKDYKIPIFIITNKLDKETIREVSGFELKEFEDKYPDINCIDVSLTEKDNLEQLVGMLFEKLYNNGLSLPKDIPYTANNLVRVLSPPSLYLESGKRDFMFPISLFIIGDGTVGKTSIIKRFYEKYIDFTQHLQTVGLDKENTLATVDGTKIRVEVWDTVGQEKFKAIQRRYYQKSDGFFIVFDVTSEESFNNVVDWLKEIRENRDGPVGENDNKGNNNNIIKNKKKDKDEAIILIGNKIDLVNERKVDKKIAQQLAEANGIKYIEISCKTDVNIYEAFNELIFQAFLSVKKNYKTSDIILGKGDKASKRGCC